MAKKIITTKGFKEFERAIKRNPAVVALETKKFFQRGLAVYLRIINRTPWRVGQSGGGAPVSTGNLRGLHTRKIGKTRASIETRAKYSPFVHEGTRYMKKRPWLDHAMKKGNKNINKLANDLLKNVTRDLAK